MMLRYIWLGVFPLAALAILLASPAAPSVAHSSQVTPTEMSADKGFAVIELFTSQGCSSCPPADALLGKMAMAHDAQVLPIAFHVDYWNRLGWKDPFSSASYSQRQRAYANQFHLDGVYTPQAIVNGKRQMVGSDASLLAAAVADAKAITPTASINITSIEQQADSIHIQYNIMGAYSDATLQAVLVQEQVETQIKAGENKGLSLTNYHIARDLKEVPATAAGQLYLQIPATATNTVFKIVLLVQQADGKIVGMAQKQLL
jgi:hypothetical protein